MHVVAFEPADAEEVVHMWRASFEHGVGIKDENPIEDQLRFFVSEVVPKSTVRVVKDQGLIVGFMASSPTSISQLYVRVGYVGRGIGTELLTLAKTESQGSLWLYTFAQNLNARRFYECHGFKEAGRESANMYKLEAIRYVWSRGAGEA